MRRLLLSTLAVAGAVALAAGLFQLWRMVRAARPEIPLGDGTALVIEGVTWGTNQSFSLEPEHWTRLKRSLPASWLDIVGQPLPPHELRGTLSPHLWLSRRDLATGRYVPVPSSDIKALDSGGAVFHSEGHNGFGTARRAERAAAFGALDWRSPELRFQLQDGSLTQVVAIPNPRRGERFPAWRPDPLPRTNSVGGFEFVLRGLKSPPRTSPFVHAEWSVLQGGQNVKEWFETRVEFTDPTGNRSWNGLPASEPVCKVHLTACPVGAYPFTKQQLFPVGRVSIPGPGQFTHLTLNAAASNACLHWAALTGVGSFAFRDGTNRIAQPPDQPRLGSSSSTGSHGWEFTFDADRPQLHVLLRGPVSGGRLLPGPTNQLDRPVLRARTRAGSAVTTSSRGYSSNSDGTTITRWLIYEIAPLAPGEALDLDLVLATPLQVEFTVAAPHSP